MPFLATAYMRKKVQILTQFVSPQRGHARPQFPFVPWQRGHFSAEFGSPQARHHEGKHFGEGGKYICGRNGKTDNLWGNSADSPTESVSQPKEICIC